METQFPPKNDTRAYINIITGETLMEKPLLMSKDTHLIADVKGKYNCQHARGRVSAMALCPPVVGVLKERWIHHYNLQTRG
jgi:hypothetical protein